MYLAFEKPWPKLITSKCIFSDLDQQKRQRHETNRLRSHQSRSKRFLTEVQKKTRRQLVNKSPKKKNKMLNKLKAWRQGLGQKGTLEFDKEQALAKLIGIVKSNNLQEVQQQQPPVPQTSTTSAIKGIQNLPKSENSSLPPLTKPMKLSADLADIVGKDEASRAECIKLLWVYIKKNNLQDPENKQYFTPDEKMAKVFGVDRIRTFGKTKFLNNQINQSVH